MKYNQTVSGTFLQRPNRFIAHVLIQGKEEICHVKNTGRCRELLVPGCKVYCEVSDNPNRKTRFDLVAVEKVCKNRTLLVNMDSQAPNAVVKEWIASGKSVFGKVDYLKPEYKYRNSRFDFYLECPGGESGTDGNAGKPGQTKPGASTGNSNGADSKNKHIRKIFIEVKGVTLEDNGIVSFPDAPTERGLKHIRELIQCRTEGFESCVLFVIQMESATYFTPNRKTHPQFADALCDAEAAGVHLLARTCRVTPGEMSIARPLEIKLKPL